MDYPRFVLAQKNCSTNLVSYFRERHNEMQKKHSDFISFTLIMEIKQRTSIPYVGCSSLLKKSA